METNVIFIKLHIVVSFVVNYLKFMLRKMELYMTVFWGQGQQRLLVLKMVTDI